MFFCFFGGFWLFVFFVLLEFFSLKDGIVFFLFGEFVEVGLGWGNFGEFGGSSWGMWGLLRGRVRNRGWRGWGVFDLEGEGREGGYLVFRRKRI